MVPRTIRNIARVSTSPRMLWRFSLWTSNQWIRRRPPTATFYEDVRFGEFVSFSEYWLRHGGLDLAEIGILEACLKASSRRPVAFDVGANLGVFTLALAKAGYAQVHAFEPAPETHARLVANVSRNAALAGRVIVNRDGVGAKEGTFDFAVNRTSPGQSKLATAGTSTAASVVCRCNVTTIDAYVASHDIAGIDFLKIDVEGFEVEALRGGVETLRSGRVRFVYSEVIAEALTHAGTSVEEFFRLLADLKFDPAVVEADGSIRRIPFESALCAAHRRNVLFQFRAGDSRLL